MASLCVSVPNLANKNRIENPLGFSEVGENKQLFLHGVIACFNAFCLFTLVFDFCSFFRNVCSQLRLVQFHLL